MKHLHHGILREDPWHWIRDRHNPEVLEHLRKENAHTASVMAAVGDLPDRLYRELVGRIEENNCSAPYPEGDYIYQSRIEAGQNYRSYYRKPRLGDGDWTKYFDANREAAGQAYFDLGFLDVSPDGRTLAYAVDTKGEELYTLAFRDLESGKDLPGRIEEVSPDGEWDAAGKVYFFLKEDEVRRPFSIYRYLLGTDPEKAHQIYTETNPLFFAGLYKSQDTRFVFAFSESKETTEIHHLPSDSPMESFTLLFARRESIQYWVEHHEGRWLIRTNEEAPDFKLLSLAVDEIRLSEALVLVPPQDRIRLEDILPLKAFLVLFERSRGLDFIRIRDWQTGVDHLIEMADSVYDIQSGMNAEYSTECLDFTYSSPIRPAATLRYHLRTHEREVLRQNKVPSGHDPEAYTVYRLETASHDGVGVPMTVIHHRDLHLDGGNPAYLYGYGAYGSIVEPAFRSSWLTWLQRGFVVAIAHVRGGGILGEHWYQDGKFSKKANTFKDFIACAEALVEEGFTTPDQLAIEGGSAGGLLIGAALNLRPDLFKAAVARVPFVDVVNTMLDPDLPLTTYEYEEWGNPEEKSVFDNLMAYSPYDNVRNAAYPALFVTAAFNDPRVQYWEAVKWVAKLRKHHTGDAPILLKTNLDSGHMGASGRYEYLRETALQQAFLLHHLGKDDPLSASGGS